MPRERTFEEAVKQYTGIDVFCNAFGRGVRITDTYPNHPQNSLTAGWVLEVSPSPAGEGLTVRARIVYNNLAPSRVSGITELVIGNEGIEAIQLAEEVTPAGVAERLRAGLEIIHAYNSNPLDGTSFKTLPGGGIKQVSFDSTNLRNRLRGFVNESNQVELPNYLVVLNAMRENKLIFPE